MLCNSCSNYTIWPDLDAVKVNISEFLLLLVVSEGFTPGAHVLHERLDILFFATVKRLLVLADLTDVAASDDICEAKVVLVKQLLHCARYFVLDNLLANVGFLANWSRKADTMDGP